MQTVESTQQYQSATHCLVKQSFVFIEHIHTRLQGLFSELTGPWNPHRGLLEGKPTQHIIKNTKYEAEDVLWLAEYLPNTQETLGSRLSTAWTGHSGHSGA